ncbi:MAG: hypothetical protein CUN55_05850 [Phototrophicales bacterium]|nr:MAG: hypothetical protein CUN55_05850 [Phototrophicales bacterium]
MLLSVQRWQYKPIQLFVWLLLGLGLLLGGTIQSAQAQQSSTIRVEGRVERGTPNSIPLPSNMLIELQAIDAATATPLQTLTTFADANGHFIFENVRRLSGNNFYILYTTYDGLRQNTQPLFASQMNFVVFLVYEVRPDPVGVEIVGGSIQIDEFANITDGGTNLVVLMQLEIVNRGDYIIYDQESGTSLAIELPVGAFSVDEVTPEQTPNLKHLQIEDGVIPIIRDTIPLIPSWPTHTIRVTYFIPYPDSAVFDQPFPVKTSNLRIWIPAESVFVESTHISLAEEDQILSPERPPYDVYEQVGSLQPNESLVFTLQGEPPKSTSRRYGLPNTSEEDEKSAVQRILIIVGIILLAIVGFVVWWSLRARQAHLDEVLERKTQ